MDDTLYHYIDPGFSHTQVHNYTLVVLIGSAQFSLAIVHQHKLMVWRKPAPLSELAQPGEVQEVLNFAYQSILSGAKSSAFTLVPQPLFKTETVAQVARFLDVQPQDTVFAQPLDTENHIVFKLNETSTMAAARFDLGQTLFGASGWIQAIAGNQPSEYNLYININENRFDLVYFRQGKLLLFNTFECANADELAYYTLFVTEQLNLTAADVNVLLSGSVNEGDAYVQRLANFYKSATINSVQVIDIPEHLPKHQLLALSALTLCASLADV
ncbi:DUF3822 family protein [Mucilaginibacter sp. Bleaf8]|uniref:DUF3822 family protein n=1 Tax=Mucilaginibacter sp. Bleaf8 TaxID=2834430 RepID=UPI001BD0888B|nr:DUF3822 family protein [Mucilaginibacter sp. Bleaf8]MBS7564553.1 DUF3822 family protein [Mucilaginibacter sp. Bleaf8]